jgi:hypothetical protein
MKQITFKLSAKTKNSWKIGQLSMN